MIQSKDKIMIQSKDKLRESNGLIFKERIRITQALWSGW